MQTIYNFVGTVVFIIILVSAVIAVSFTAATGDVINAGRDKKPHEMNFAPIGKAVGFTEADAHWTRWEYNGVSQDGKAWKRQCGIVICGEWVPQ